jgi:hypothetical protein
VRHAPTLPERPERLSSNPFGNGRRIVVVITPVRADAPPFTAKVKFRRVGDNLLVDYAPQVMWFAHHILAPSRAIPEVGLSFDGTHVTLHAFNGQWIWKLTGRVWCRGYVPGAESLVMVEGIWPD